MSNGFGLTVTAAKPAIRKGSDNIIDVLVRVQAPDAPKTGLPERPRLNLSIVIDRSGSMNGQPLHEAKRAAVAMIDRLNTKDRASVVVYDNAVQVIAKSAHVSNKELIKAAIARVESGGRTNLHGGWLKGAEECARHLERDVVSRVLLLSDGNANEGVTGTDEIASQCSQLAQTGVTTSTYGLGRSFNEELMTAMALSGRGNAYYSESAELLLERFNEEFSLLSALCARNVRLLLSPLPGVKLETLNLYEAAGEQEWRLPDLVYDAEGWAAVRLRVESKSIPEVGDTLAVLQASVLYDNLEGAEQAISEVWLTLPVLDEKKFAGVATDRDVVRRVNEAEGAQIQEKATRAAKNGDWDEVSGLLARAREMAAHSEYLAQIVANLEQLAAQRDQVLFRKEALYAAHILSKKIRSKREFDPAFRDSAMPAYLQRRVKQGRRGHLGDDVSEGKYRPFARLIGFIERLVNRK